MPFTKYEKWAPRQFCKNPEHNPPTMINLPPGIHTYECPACGYTQTIKVQEPTCTYHSE